MTHAEREAEALSLWWAAVGRKDHAEQHRLWEAYAEIHAQRPPAVVRALEEAKGLR
jgi:hypothetical protein